MLQPADAAAEVLADIVADGTDSRITEVVTRADLTEVAAALTTGRDRVLARWLDAASRQPFHEGRTSGAVADHVPPLFDAVVALMERQAPPEMETTAPLDDESVAREARAHAQARFEQGMGPVAVVTEFRLLRQEIARELSMLVDEEARPADVVAGIAIVSDALDGAATIGLSSLSDSIEALRESFLATFLHDIRQPVTLVEGSLHLSERWLRTPPLDPERVLVSVRDALSATVELVAMIDTLSDASRLALGALDANVEPVSLTAVVRTALGSFGVDARARIDLEAPPGAALVGLWDGALIGRLVVNLISNALKYSPVSSTVRITVGEGGAGRARLVVADDGLGMSPDELSSAFERFARAERTRAAGIPGLGLGLYACRGIVTAHGGTIAIASEGADRGTTVTVELPLLDRTALED
jgi:signal transduction histidine kinase